MTDRELKNRARAAIRGRSEDIVELAKEYASEKDKRIQMLYDKVTSSKIRIEDLENEFSRLNDENLRLRYGLGCSSEEYDREAKAALIKAYQDDHVFFGSNFAQVSTQMWRGKYNFSLVMQGNFDGTWDVFLEDDKSIIKSVCIHKEFHIALWYASKYVDAMKGGQGD